MARLILHFLGPFRATLNGAPLDGFDSNKVRALLAYLAMERNRPHSREVLAGMLWPEQSQRSAMDNLRYALADLRKVLGDADGDHPFLIVSRELIQFDPASDFWLDVVEFERLCAQKQGLENDPSQLPVQHLQEAVHLYQGGFLEGFTVSRSAPFEEWMLNRREHLHRELVSNLYFLAVFYERLGLFQPAFQATWRLVELEPWQEEAQQQLMRLLVFDGQRSAALEQYETCKKILANELGVEPSDQTRRLYESIRDGTLYIPFHFARPPQLPGEIHTQIPRSHFFAREEELQQLSNNLEACLAGRNQVLFVTGEAGSGKTSLVKEFINLSLQRLPGLVAVYSNCNAFTGTSDPYLPFIEILSMLTGDLDQFWIMGSGSRDIAARLWSAASEAVQALIESGPDLIGRLVAGEELLARARVLPRVKTDRLETILRRNEALHLQTLPGSGGTRQSGLFEQVLSVFKRIARHHSLILALDDLQWADADTVNLLFFLCRRLVGSRIMILGIYREEELTVDSSGKPSPFLSVLRELQTSHGGQRIDLSQADGRQFIQCLVDSEPNQLGDEFRHTLERVTGGIPLFSIELLRAMQERGDLRSNEHGQWVEASPLNWDQLPPRVEAVIAEQVDRLPPAWQNVLTVASVEGDDFTAETVARVLSLDPQELAQQLSGPIAKHHRMIYAAGVQQLGGEAAHLSHFRFRHHLFQHYFYFRQDIVERSRRHEEVGYALEATYGGQKSEYAISLAHHFEQAGMREKAAVYLLQAGKKAVSLFANERAIAHFHKGLELISSAPQSPERDFLELSLLVALSGPLITTHGYTSSELERVLARARKLIRKDQNDTGFFWVLSLLKSYYNIRGDPANSQEIAALILKMARRSKNTGLLVTAHARLVSNCLYYGQWAALQKHLKQTNRLYDIEQHRWILQQAGSDPKSNALALAALGTWISGYPDQARTYCRAALALAQELANPMVSWFADYYAALFFGYTGEIQEAQSCVERALRICEEQDLAYYHVYSQALQGWILANAGNETGLTLLEQGANRLRQTGDRLNLLLLLRLQANACLNYGFLTQALDIVEEALALSHETQIIYEKPEIIRLKGEILLAQSPDDPQKAEGCFLLAVESAILQKSKMWELRAASSLARLCLKTDRQEETLARLQAIYVWFTEGFDTPDLIQTRKLLE